MIGGRKGRVLRLLTPCVRASGGKIAAGLLCAGLASGVSLSIPWTIKLAIEDVFSARTLALPTFAAGLLLLYVFRNIFVFVGRRSMLVAGENTALTLRGMLFQHLQTLSTGPQANRGPGESLSRVMGDVSQVEGFVETGLPKTANTILLVAGVLIIIFVKHPALAALSLAVVPLHLLLYIGFRNPIKSGNRRMRERQAGLASGLVESLMGGKVVAASTAETREQDRFLGRANGLLDSKLKLGSMHLWQKVLADVAVGLGTVGVWYYGGRMVMNSPMKTGEFMAFLGYVGMLYPLSLTLMTQMGHTLGTAASAERILDLLDTAPDVADDPQSPLLTSVRGEVTFEDVHFSYNGTAAGIRGLNAAIRPREVVAIVGPVGSGKSTLGYLLARFYDVTHGKIYLDGVELGDLPLGQLRDEVGIAFQEPFLFSDTIANNIRYPAPEAGDWAVLSAAEAVGLAPLAESLPDGLNTMIGGDGVQLSLGQKRRIDMARMLIKDPRVLVLDSVFTEGDEEHRLEEEKVFRHISRDRTTFVVDPPAFILERATKVIHLRRSGAASVEDRLDEIDA